LGGSTPLEQWRAQGPWPGSLDRFWEGLKQRIGKQLEPRHGSMYFCWVVNMGMDLLKEALEKALDLSRFDVEAVRLLLAWTCRRKSDKHIRSLRKPTPYARGANQGA